MEVSLKQVSEYWGPLPFLVISSPYPISQSCINERIVEFFQGGR